MAAKKPSNVVDIATMIQVTEVNRKFAVVLGRVLAICEPKGNDLLLVLNEFDIRPRLKKGWRVHGSHKFYCTEDESREEYANSFKEILDTEIKKGRLYFNPKKHIVKYE
jgi:hypothetical protein